VPNLEDDMKMTIRETRWYVVEDSPSKWPIYFLIFKSV